MTTYIICLIAGFLLMWIKTIDSARRKTNFKWAVFFDENMFKLAFSAVCAAICALTLEYFFGVINISGLNYIIAFMVGFNCVAIINEWMKVTRKRIKPTRDEDDD